MPACSSEPQRGPTRAAQARTYSIRCCFSAHALLPARALHPQRTGASVFSIAAVTAAPQPSSTNSVQWCHVSQLSHHKPRWTRWRCGLDRLGNVLLLSVGESNARVAVKVLRDCPAHHDAASRDLCVNICAKRLSGPSRLTCGAHSAGLNACRCCSSQSQSCNAGVAANRASIHLFRIKLPHRRT